MPDSSIVMAVVTAPSAEVAEQIVTAVVEERLSACGNIVPGVTSIYRWEDRLQREGEVLIFLKTTRVALPQLMRRVEELHPYDVPEMLALPVTAGLPAYTRWVAANVNG